jgi:hypothetical protein
MSFMPEHTDACPASIIHDGYLYNFKLLYKKVAYLV